MKFKNTIYLELGEFTDIYYKLLLEEDYNFKSKDIKINIKKVDGKLFLDYLCNNFLDFKIANSSILKSLEIITKTINVSKD